MSDEEWGWMFTKRFCLFFAAFFICGLGLIGALFLGATWAVISMPR